MHFQGFLQLQKFRSGETMDACHILAMIVGEEGSGKTTFAQSMRATKFFTQLLRSEDQEDTGAKFLPSCTIGMEFSDFVDRFKNTIHFVDYAGQAEFALTHDVFSPGMPIPRIAFILVNAMQDAETIERKIKDAASVVMGRSSTTSTDSKYCHNNNTYAVVSCMQGQTSSYVNHYTIR